MDTNTANALKQIVAALHCTAAALDTIASATCASETKAPTFLPDAEEQSLREESSKKAVFGMPSRNIDPAFVESAKTPTCPPQIAVAAKVAQAKAQAAEAKPVEPAEAAPKAKAKVKKVETAAEVETTQEPTGMTLAQFRDAISPVAASKGFDKVKAIFAKYGASVISQVKPSDYNAILEELKNA